MICETLEEIDFAIIKAIQSKPGINAVGISEKAHVSRYTALLHTEKLEGLGYIERKQKGGHTFKNYLAPEVDLDELENARLQQDRNFLSDVMTEQKQGNNTLQYWKARLLGVSRKPRETLILLAKHKEITGQDLADASSKHITYQTVVCRLRKLMDLGLVQRKHCLGNRGYLYFLTPPLTKEIIEESLLGIVPDSSEEDDEITCGDTPLPSLEMARLLAKEQFSDEEAAPTNEDARVHQLLDNNHESLEVDTTKQEANGYNQSETSDLQPLVNLDLPPSNVPDLDTAYEIEDEIELLYGVIKAQQSEIESSKAEIESLKQRMAEIEELMGQSDRRRDSDRITQLQAQEKIARRSQRMQSIKSFAPASISLPSEQTIASNGKA